MIDFNQKQSRQQRSFKQKDNRNVDYEYTRVAKPHKKEKYNDWKQPANWEGWDD